MKLGTRARLAWIPLALWSAAALWIGTIEAVKWKGDDVQDWIVLALGGVFLFAAGAWNLVKVRNRAAERARVEGPDVDEPVTWYRKSGSWAVILFAAGVFGTFGLVWLISGQIR
ncbi:hypothetical protein [Caulobacter sp. DWR2-3-1b2]|uniref:hypothetical protein n=1 Tax=unclassified Caulobacter TaxID=2648921 RepID=UPI0019AA7A94|nr:hypothetical protein [Caulobacter sp.]